MATGLEGVTSTMNGIEQIILFALGCIFLVIGGSLIAWSAVQNRTQAGAEGPDVSAILKAAAKLVDAFAKYFPTTAGKYGWALVVVGLVLIFLPFYLPSGGAPKS
jgi:hypothetical protein